MGDDDRDEYPSRRLLAMFHGLGLGIWRIEEALRVLAERRKPRRNPLDSPSGFHAKG